MKIGILTFYCAHNYGAVMQAYALQETLKDMEFDVLPLILSSNINECHLFKQ
jgi:hypothetical protein